MRDLNGEHVTFVVLTLNPSPSGERDFESLAPLLPAAGERAGG